MRFTNVSVICTVLYLSSQRSYAAVSLVHIVFFGILESLLLLFGTLDTSMVKSVANGS